MQDINQPYEVPGYLKVSKVIVYFVYFWVIFGIITLTIRVFLLAFSANPTTAFVEFIYKTSNDYLAPFRGIFPPKAVSETGYLDIAAIFAIIMYMIFAWGVSAAIGYIQSKIDHIKEEEQERLKKVETQSSRRSQARN